MDEVMLPAHHHPLVLKKYPAYRPFQCHWCSTKGLQREWYYCDICKCNFHRECVELAREINHPLHPRHPLALFSVRTLDVTNQRCHLCGVSGYGRLYHCTICSFSAHAKCLTENAPAVVIDHPKSHEHKLALISREISFTCDACGEVGDRCPYVCPQCNFMVHEDCTNLPRVIKINRHKHRISLTYSLGSGNWVCGVCQQKVDRKYGAYSCSDCSYAVHTKCATRDDMWNRRELEGIPDEIDQIEEDMPFKMIDDEVINHFSHEHDLRLKKKGSMCDEGKLCQACVLPICFSPFYSCMQCDFILHQTCANLPLKKLHELLPQPFSIRTNNEELGGVFCCSFCDRLSTGFRYESKNGYVDINIDVRCGSISEPFIHEGHPHPLFFTRRRGSCMACKLRFPELNCTECDFLLCLKCATLPRMVRHKYDEHPVILRLGEDVSGPYWCDICEKRLNPKKRFYACDECGFTSHVECVLGHFPFVKPGHRFSYEGLKFEAIENNGTSWPFCGCCERRCQFPSILKSTQCADTYLCSPRCLWELVDVAGSSTDESDESDESGPILV